MKTGTKWSIDQAHSEIAFQVRHLMIAHVKGAFKVFKANIHTTGKDFTTAVIDLRIDAASISTGDAQRDRHLLSSDFFDVANHSELSFTSNTVGKSDRENHYEMLGELTIKGIAKIIKLSVEFGGIINDPWGNEKAGFTITGKINRSDWGLVWNTLIEMGGVMVGEEVTISCEVELINAIEKKIRTKLKSPSERVVLSKIF